MTTFRDHFSGVAPDYAAFRPRYPDALFAAIAALAPGRALAWDAGTGSGQAALGLARHFDRVVATDASAAQLAAAEPHPRVEYRVGAAEASGLPDAACDVVTAAQALHWFDVPRFGAEAARVLRPGGVLAVWCYGLLETRDAAADAAIREFERATVGPYWPPERRLVDDGYAGVALPFADAALPPFAIEAELTLDELAGYLRTWSATLRYSAARGRDPVAPLADALAPRWRGRRPVRWPVAARACRKPPA